MSRVELPPIPKLERPEAITTPQGIETLRAYMWFMVKRHSLKPVHPFTDEDMFQYAYMFLFERAHKWDANGKSNFDTWATDMLRYGWLHAVRDMHWAGYRAVWKKWLIDDRHMSRFVEDSEGNNEIDMMPDSSDDFDILLEDMELENLLSQLSTDDRQIAELLLEGKLEREVESDLGISIGAAGDAKKRIARTLNLQRPPAPKRFHELTDNDRVAIIDQYKTLGALDKVSEKLYIDYRSVSRVVRDAKATR